MWDDGAKALGLARGRPRRLGRRERGGSSGTTSDDEDDEDASFFAPVIPIARLRVSFYASRTQKLTARVSLSSRVSSTGQTINAGIDPSKVLITKLHMDKDRKALLARKGGAGKFTEEEMQNVE